MMNSLRNCFLVGMFSSFVFPLFAQGGGVDTVITPLYKSNVLSNPDTSIHSGEIPQGVIFVRKPHITPFVKVDYKLFLSHVNMVQVEIPVNNGIPGNVEIDNQPRFDSNIYSKRLKRAYPVSATHLSKYFVENMTYQYQPNDTPRVDTMVVGLWIDAHGKVRRAMPDTTNIGNMSAKLVNELMRTSWSITDWGIGGGYFTTKRFLNPPKLIQESYYCEVFVIVSSYPLTQEQKKSGVAYAPFDYPLNSPPLDSQQRLSMEKNGISEPH